MKKNKRLLVLGIGNVILGDEGVGVHAVAALKGLPLPECVDVVDGGTAGLTLMSLMQSYEKVIVIDAGVDKNVQGTIRHIHPHYSKDYPPLITVHELGLKDVIEAMQLIGYCPEIEMVVVSVKKYDAISLDLSEDISSVMLDVIILVKTIIDIETR